MAEFAWNERVITTAIARQVLNRRCLLLVDRCIWTGYECDVLGVTQDLRIIDIEVKISRADLKADADKDKWWRNFSWTLQGGRYVQPERQPRPWPHKVWKHYYALPESIWKPELLEAIPSPHSGVILLKQVQQFRNAIPITVARVKRRAHPNKDASRLTAEEVLDIARLGNLRMWNAYEELSSAASQLRELRAQLKKAA